MEHNTFRKTVLFKKNIETVCAHRLHVENESAEISFKCDIENVLIMSLIKVIKANFDEVLGYNLKKYVSQILCVR